jgi:hypothetical protein
MRDLDKQTFGLVNMFEQSAYKLQWWYMKRKITREVIGEHVAFFHPRDTSGVVLKKYEEILKPILLFKDNNQATNYKN